jgi:hypothetical protein
MGCRRCGARLGYANVTGYCHRCWHGVRCTVCRGPRDVPGSAWCWACHLAGGGSCRHDPVRPDLGTLAERVALYAARAEAGRPLFGGDG